MKRATTVRKVRWSGEAKLIERLARAIPSIRGAGKGSRGNGELRLGIGDDAAVLAGSGSKEWVLSCDAFLEGVHFLGDVHPADSVGYKALARAASDLAAMGARPRFFLLTLALPDSRTGKWLDEFLRGMGRAARELGIELAGGDTTKFAQVSISITVIGEVARGQEVTRSGARPGDAIYVSGTLGRAELGLKCVRSGVLKRGKGGFKGQFKLLQPHLYPKIHVELGAWLAGRRVASAMMDLSDGLSMDLPRLCAASGVGARIWAERIPRVAKDTVPGGMTVDPLEMALHGGEDYELLFTVPRRLAKRLEGAPGFGELRAIGEIERGGKIVVVGEDGKARALASGGWDPFRRK